MKFGIYMTYIKSFGYKKKIPLYSQKNFLQGFNKKKLSEMKLITVKYINGVYHCEALLRIVLLKI